MKYQSLFSGKIKKHINLSSAEFAQRVVKVKIIKEKLATEIILTFYPHITNNYISLFDA